MFIDAFKKYILPTLLLFLHCNGSEPPIAGLIGGSISGPPTFLGYAGTVSPFGSVTSLSISSSTRLINSVALNKMGIGLLGGEATNLFPYAAFVSSNKGVEPISGFPSLVGEFNSVAINSTNLGLVGGRIASDGYAAFVSPYTATPILLDLAPGTILSVALNESGFGLIGGQHLPFIGEAYAALVSPGSSTATEILLNLPTGLIQGVAINDSGLGLIGGGEEFSASAPAFAAFVVDGIAIPIPLNLDPGILSSVALNNSSLGLIGGNSGAAFVAPNSAAQNIPQTSSAHIESVAINALNQGIIGGFLDSPTRMYAALVSPGAQPTVLLGLPSSGVIFSVAINQFNQGLIGGEILPTEAPYLAIVSPSGAVTPLNIGISKCTIQSVALNMFFLSQIPTAGLKGNNLIFANYINKNAPQKVFYFVPALAEGSLADALESAAPTRNALSFNTVLQNSFYLTTNLSAHLRNGRLISSRALKENDQNSTALLEVEEPLEDEFLTSRCLQKPKQRNLFCSNKRANRPNCNTKPYTVWFDAIGALAYQDAQHQTPAFDPTTGGVTLAFDAKVTEQMVVGGGTSYLYTHIHEKQGAGSSNINQEDLFLYGSWQPNQFYLDLGLWGGLFQTDQTRKIHMPGFQFASNSKPHGWQLVPHLELGWIVTARRTQKSEITCNLFAMGDWANAWQEKFKEKGSGPFNVQQKSHHGSLLRSEASLRFSETLFFSCWNLIFQEKGGYVNIQSFNAGKLNAFLIGSPGSFTVETLTGSQNLGVAQFSITAAPYRSCYPTSMILYQGEFGSRYQSHQINVEFSWNF